jgi:hypothetical protein
MEILTLPKSTQENDQWFRNEIGGCPSRPEKKDVEEYMDEPIFIHPAEKPQSHGPVYRANLYDTV